MATSDEVRNKTRQVIEGAPSFALLRGTRWSAKDGGQAAWGVQLPLAYAILLTNDTTPKAAATISSGSPVPTPHDR